MRAGLSELYLSIDEFWGRATELAEVLAAVDAPFDTLACRGHYAPDDDRAIIVLVFDPRRCSRSAIDRMASSLYDYRVDCFELDALSRPEREHFEQVELQRHTVTVEAAEDAAAAVSELFRRANADESHDGWATGTPAEKRRRPLSVGSYSRVRRRTTEHGLRANLVDYPELPPLDPVEDLASSTLEDLGDDEPTPVMTRNPRAKSPSTIGTPPLGGPSLRQSSPRITANVMRRPPAGSGAPAAPLPDLSPPPARVGGRPSLRVRFMRGERWLPGRVRYVSNREIRVATGAPLRLGDAAIVCLSFLGDEVFVSGTVSNVDAIDSEPSSSPGFSLTFSKLPESKVDHLVRLLSAARDAGVALKPPPVRGAPRFPVSWPIVARTNGVQSARRAVALDVSWSGLYLDVPADIGTDILFAIPLDNIGDSIRGRGRVVRSVSAEQAAEFQTVPGCGVVITHFASGDAERYKAFLDRVKSRCQRRIVVAASASRASGLTKALSAAGYAVTSSTDPNALAEIANSEPRPPDIVVIDASLSGSKNGEMLQSLFRARNVPCLSTSGEQSDLARQVVDRMLSV